MNAGCTGFIIFRLYGKVEFRNFKYDLERYNNMEKESIYDTMNT